MSSILAVARYTPPLLTFTLYLLGLWHKEIYLVLFAFGMTGSSLINWLFNNLMEGVIPPRVATCIPVNGTALSFESQQIAFFATFALGYAALYEARLKLWHILLLGFFYSLVFYGDHVLNYHRAETIVAAATLGVVLALCYQYFLYLLVVPSLPYVMRNGWVFYIGYEDSMCYTNTVSALGQFVLRSYDEEFSDKIVTRAALFQLIKQALRDYLARDHTIFRESDIDSIQPTLFADFDAEFGDRPLSKERVREFVAKYV